MIFTLILVGITVVLLAWVSYLHYTLYKTHRANKELLGQAQGSNLEEILNSQNKNLKTVQDKIRALKDSVKKLEEKLDFTVQKVNIVRFNPFADEGGDQSFSIALLDRHKSGVVISNLHSSTGDRIYAKPVFGGQSKYQLTKEELEAINKRG